MSEQQELSEQEREELEDSLSDDTNMLSGQGCTDGIGYAPMIARYCTRADLKAINTYFDACDKAWKEYLDPVIEKCMDREQAERRLEEQRKEASITPHEKAERQEQRAFLDMFIKGELPPPPAWMTPAPTTTGTQAQIQVQPTVTELPPVTPRQLLQLTIRYHVPQPVIDKLNKWTAARLIAELQERSNI
jgi:hypothetical protein